VLKLGPSSCLPAWWKTDDCSCISQADHLPTGTMTFWVGRWGSDAKDVVGVCWPAAGQDARAGNDFVGLGGRVTPGYTIRRARWQ
jgi:hypothetical protein